MYDMLAHFYKYLDPNMHIFFYKKHLCYLRKAINTTRTPAHSNHHRNLQPAISRFLHASPDAPNVDIYVNAILVKENLPFKDAGNYFSMPAGKYHIDIYPSGNMVSTIITKKITVEAGMVNTFALIGTGNKLQLLPFQDQPGVPNGETKLRFMNLSPDTPTADIAVNKGDVVFPKVAYKKASSYLGLSPMTVNLEVREAGTKEVLLPIPNLQLKANESYTIAAVGFRQGETALEMIILNDY